MKYIVHGRLGVQFEPKTVIRVGPIRVGDLSKFPEFEPPGNLDVDSGEPYVATAEIQPRFATNGRFRTEVEAATHLDLLDKVSEEVEPLIHAVVSLLVGAPVIVRATTTVEVVDDDEISSGVSRVVGYRQAPPATFERAAFIATLDAVRSEPIIQGAFKHLQRMHDVRLLSGPFRDTANDIELLELAKAIEWIASDARFKDKAGELRVKHELRDAAIDRFRARFEETKSTEQAATAIRRASEELERANESSNMARVLRMADQLGLSQEWKQDVKDLFQVRNGIAHPRTSSASKREAMLGDERHRSRAWELLMECLANLAGIKLAEWPESGTAGWEFRLRADGHPKTRQ